MHQVDYHRSDRTQEHYNISSYRDIFVKDEQSFQNIYVTGDAGVGKTSLCKCLCLLWCKSQTGVTVDNPEIQSDINFLARFDFVFYVSLRDTECRDVVSMIVDQYFYSDSKVDRATIEHVLKQHKCLVVFDAFDEWSPRLRGKRECRIPDRVYSDTCVYLTTCRPYKIENVRLSRREIDQYVRISGIHGESSKRFIAQVVEHMNKENGAEKNADDFIKEVEECGLIEQLCIPMIASHLVVVWFAQKLTDMSIALLYGKIVELLFTRAKQRNVKSPASPPCEVQFREIISKFRYFNEHKYLIQKLCILSFKSLFIQEGEDFSLVFTREQLMSEPYVLVDDEMDFLCKIGILSKNKVIGCFEERKQKLSFLHTSYMEFFAALFLSSFDTENILDRIELTSVKDVVKYQNFFILLAGMSYQKVQFLFDKIYMAMSDDLDVCRINDLFHNHLHDMLKLLQAIVINCWKEGGRCNDPNPLLQLQDFIFDDDSDLHTLKHLISNASFVNSLHLYRGRYLEHVDWISKIQCFKVSKIEPGDYPKFNEFMLQNLATLRTLSIEGDFNINAMVLALPVHIPQYLTSLGLSKIKMQHKDLQDLVYFLSDNVLIENLHLEYLYCANHQESDTGCTLTLTLHGHTKLNTLNLQDVNILCHNVNGSCLKSILLRPLSERIVSCYTDILTCIQKSQLEFISINGFNKLDNHTISTLVSTIKSLSEITLLELYSMSLPDGVLLQLHPGVAEELKINVYNVNMSRQYFHSFVDSCRV